MSITLKTVGNFINCSSSYRIGKGGYTTSILNFTNKPVYGVDIMGNCFILFPENDIDINTGIVVNLIGNSSEDDYQIQFHQLIDSKWYEFPRPGFPTYIEECNSLLFATIEDRSNAFKQYGDATRIIKAYASGTLPIINASYISVTCLNSETDLYMISNSQVIKIPYDKDALDISRRYNVTQEILETNYVLALNTIVRSGNNRRHTKDHQITSEIRCIRKDSLVKGEPIILNSNGLVIFDSKEKADDFLRKFEGVGSYLVYKALQVTKESHVKDMLDLNDRAKKDKKEIVQMFGIMGGTSIISLVTENVIKEAMSKDSNSEGVKKSLMLLGITSLAAFGIYAGYSIYKKFKDKEKK